MKMKKYSVLLMVMLLTMVTNFAAFAQNCGTTSYTIGAWSSDPHGANGGTILNANFSTYFPNGFTIGCGNKTVTFNSPDDVRAYLTMGGGPVATLPAHSTLAEQLVGATINMNFYNLGNEVFTSGPFAGTSVKDFLAGANQAIGGCSGSLGNLTEWATHINENYDKGTNNEGYLSCCDNVGPVFSGVDGNKTIECSDAVVFSTPTATDAQDGTVSVSSSDSRSAGTCSYTITRTWTATDKCNNTTTASQTITVQDTTAPVLVDVPADASVSCGNVPAAPVVTATDNCNTASVTFSELTTAGNCSGNYTITRTWTASDGCGNSSSASQTITITDTTAPVLAGVPPDASVSCGNVPAAATVTASDNCSGATVALSESTTAGNCAGNYTITRIWTAIDGCGNSSSATQIVTVSDTQAPVLAGVPADASASCDNIPAAANVTATDNCSGASVALSETITAGSCAGNYTITRTWTATDGCGNSSSAAQTISVTDTKAPVFSNVPANTTASCGNVAASVAPTATDNCSGVANVAFNEVVTAGNCVGNYTITRKWTATDGCGNSSSVSQTISVIDNQAPVFANVPANTTASCSNIPASVAPTATDNCSGVTVAFNELKSAVDCSGNYTITRTWTATDGCGNASSASQAITVNEIACKYTTVTQGGWGANCSGGNWGCYLDKNFASNFPTGLTVGSVVNGKYVSLTSASAIHGFLPTGGTPTALTKAWTNPTKKTLGNTLVGQAVTLTLNVKFFPSSANLVVLHGSFAGQTVSQMLAIANAVLGGSTTYTATSVNDVLNNININFDNGNGTNLGFLGYCVPNTGSRDIANDDSSSPTAEFVSISTYPNPFVDKVRIEFAVEETSHVNLQLFNSNGANVGTLYNDVAEKGVKYNAEFTASQPGMYIYRMSTSRGIVTGKVIQIK